jgi:hypothetical protein
MESIVAAWHSGPRPQAHALARDFVDLKIASGEYQQEGEFLHFTPEDI